LSADRQRRGNLSGKYHEETFAENAKHDRQSIGFRCRKKIC
jgi:hypothetical protein